MKSKDPSPRPETNGAPLLERRRFERIDIPATAFALDANGNELGRVIETSGGGLRLHPASPFARISLAKFQQLVITVVEATTGKKTKMKVEVRYVRSNSIGLRFL
jgi:hypothetical protein